MARDGGDRSGKPVTTSSFGSPLSRRAFLGATGAIAVGLPAETYAQAEPPYFEKRANGAARLSWLGRIWEIDPQWLHSSGPTIRFDNRTQIRLQGRVAGSNLALNLKIQIKQINAKWTLVWTSGGRDQQIEIDKWLSGVALPNDLTLTTTATFASGALAVGEALRGTLRCPMRFDLKATSGADFTYSLGGSNSGRAATLAVMPYDAVGNGGAYASPGLPTEIADLLPPSAIPKMRLELGGVALASPGDGWKIGTVGDGSVLRFVPELPRIVLETLFRPEAGVFAHGWRMSSDAKSSRLIVGDERKPRSLFLAGGAELVEIYGFRNEIYAFIASLAQVPRMVQGLRYAALIRGRNRPSVLTGFRSSENIAFPITLYSLHARGEDQARYDVDFRRWQNGAPHLDRSSILTVNPWLEDNVAGSGGVEGTLTIGARPGNSPSPNHLHLGSESGATVFLGEQGAAKITENSPILRARRHLDGLDVGFLFHDYRLDVRNNGSRLIPGATGQRGIWFHPQHLQEEAFQAPDAPSTEPRGSPSLVSVLLRSVQALACSGEDEEPKLRPLGSQETYAEPGVYSKLARTRVASPTRVVFTTSNQATPFPLSVSALTNWEGLALNVTDRMSYAQLPLDEQLISLGINANTDRSTARGLVNKQFVAPDPSETAMELVTGLVFSPDSAARLRVSGEPGKGEAGLWTAQLDLLPLDPSLAGSSEVRAIWASGLNSESLISRECTKDPLALEAPFRTSINARQKAEVVLMSSGRGIAAVRALSKTGQDVPASLVRRPQKTFDYLDNEARRKEGDASGPSYHQEGVISPAPFSRFEARLTPFGADLDAQWKGEPAGNWRHWKDSDNEPFFNKAFSVQEYVHRTSLGSDMLVKVLEKGFMFPYGFRVILLRITQREPWAMAEMGAMAPMIQRFFIVPKPVIKSIPGIYQPFNGLEIPVRHARLIFERSPEIDSAMKAPPELAPLAEIVGRVFWPKFRGLDKEIEFDFEADDTGTRRSVPMLFLDNAAVHDPQTVRAVIHYYNEIAGEHLRKESHHGGRTIYAAPKEAGDTSFETDHIILKARSRVVGDTSAATIAVAAPGADPDLVQFQMDAFMEGADEPPFYPIMHEASIKVPPLDRLLGSPQGLKKVGYNSNYVQNGFDAVGNASELYLNFMDADGLMQLGGRGEVSGGLSQTPTPLAGISRANAIVGAKGRKSPSSAMASSTSRRLAETANATAQRASAMPPVGASDRTPWDLSAAEANNFQPASFFKLPKLLGCIEIDKAMLPALMSSQPKLKEMYSYTLGQANEAEDKLVGAFAQVSGKAAAAIFAALDAAEAKLCQFITEETNNPVTPSKDYTNLEHFYPELTRGLKELSRQLAQLAQAKDLPYILAQANAIMEAWRRLRGAVDAVIANPSPEPVRDIITTLRAALDGAENLIRAALRDQVSAALDAFVTNIIDPLREAILDEVFDAAGALANAWLYEALFGPIPSDLKPPITRDMLRGKIDELIKTQMSDGGSGQPAQPSGLETAPLGYALTRPVLNVITAIYRLKKQSEDLETKLLGQLAETTISTLRVALDGIASVQSLADAAVGAVDRACTIADGPLSTMFGLVTDGLPKTVVFKDLLADLDAQWLALLLKKIGTTPEAERVRRAANALRVPLNRLAEQLDPLETLRAAFPQDDSGKLDWCRSVGRIPSLIAEIQRKRRLATDALSDCAAQCQLVLTALMDLAEADRAEAVKALEIMRKNFATLCLQFTLAQLADAADEAQSTLTARLQPLGTVVVTRLAELKTTLYPLAVDLKRRASDAVITDEALVAIATAAGKVATAEQNLLALATDYTALSDKLLARVQSIAASLAADLAAPLISIHQFVYDGAGAAITLVDAAPDIVALLTGPLLARLKIAQASVKNDLEDLRGISRDPGKAASLVSRWKHDQPGLVIAAQSVSEMFDSIARGQIGALFDLNSARYAIEEAVRRLIPSRITLSYDWEADLRPYPESDPIFYPAYDAGLEPIDGLPVNDLIIRTNIQIDVLDPKNRSVSVRGTLNPFTLHVFGSNDLVKIQFTDTEFSSDGHGSPHFRTKIADVRIGTGLAFLQEIQNWMTGGGFTITPSFNPPGVEIGYSIGEPVIEMGAVTLLNVALGVSAMLPFNDSAAKFKFSFASSERPFGIIVKPYYFGGGFVSLIATAGGPPTFEIQLEFGAAAAITFGPLEGWGVISTGINLRTESGSLVLKGFVHALGEGQLGCFGMSVNIEVAVEQDRDVMTGSSVYKYSFKVGFISVDFRFKAQYDIAGGKKQSSSGAALLSQDPLPYELKYPDKQEDWITYRDHFVAEWA